MDDNGMCGLTSTKFDNIEDNMHLMLNLLKNNQTFLRYVLNLNDFPLDVEYIDSNNNIIEQPDISTPYNLIQSKSVLLTLFNANVLTDSKITMFFSPINGTNQEADPLFSNNYVFDIIIPYNNMIINSTGKMRMFRIANEICKMWDNKYIGGIGKTIMYKWNTYIINENYQGMSLYFSIDDSAYTDDCIDE